MSRQTHVSALEPSGIDAYAPVAMAQRAISSGETKANANWLQLASLGVLAGGFIGFGAIFATVVTRDGLLPGGVSALLAGLAFSLGLILVVVGGAELFTGNVLLVMGVASRRVSWRALARNWSIVYFTNFVGALGLVALVYWSGIWRGGDGAVAEHAVRIAAAKANLPWAEAFVRGILANTLVCLAIWLALSARSTTDRILAVLFPITAFVAAGFEHSIANMFFIPFGLALQTFGELDAAAGLTIQNFFLANLIPVTLGNIVGGGLFVGAIYWLAYVRAPASRNT